MLERWAWRPTRAQALALRCRILLAAAEGRSSVEIAAELGCNPNTVGRWRGRFARRGFDGLHDEPRQILLAVAPISSARDRWRGELARYRTARAVTQLRNRFNATARADESIHLTH